MYRRFRLSLLVTLLALPWGLLTAAGSDPADHSRYFPLDHPVYDWLDRAQERGLLLSLDRALRPYTRAQVRRAVAAQPREALHGFELDWLEHIERECAAELDLPAGADSAALRLTVRSEASLELRSLRPDRHDETVGLGFGGRFGPLVCDARFLRAPQLLRSPDSTWQRDPDVLPAREEGLIRPMEGYLKADFVSRGGAFGLELFFGRLARNWSPELDQSLILSGEALSFDHFGLALRSRHFTFSHLLARLDGMDYRTSADPVYRRANRFFTAHRLDIRVRDNLRFGFTESTVYGGVGASFDPALMNPFTSYRLTAIQDKDDHANNTLVALDGFWNAAGRVSLFGQFLFDDFLRRSDIQDRWAASLGLDLRDPPLAGPSTAGLRATVASSYVYDTFKPWERYTLEGRSLGAPLGDDYWSAGAYLRRFLGPELDVTARLDLTTRGARRIASPAADLVGSAGLPFPTPTAERSLGAGLGLRWQALDWAFLKAECGFSRVHNRDNHPGEGRRCGWGSLSVSLYHDTVVSF
ncbi:capsule assembly Wzi family protein [bacterium]|nr:capsule assembly Wzi family protein [bacterium]